jgi:beta-phosphoglucomutase
MFLKKLPFCPEGIIFDMDGVITDTMSYHFKAWKRALEANGIKVDYCDIYLREGQKGIETALELMAENNIRSSAEKAKEILELKEKIFKDIAKYKLIKGSRKLVKDLKKNKFKLALVTGTARDEVKHILPPDLYALFDVSITGDEVRAGKPNPEPFLMALGALKLNSAQCLVLENAPLGIKSAKAAGLYCIAVSTYLPPKHLKEADLILESLDEADKIICRRK